MDTEKYLIADSRAHIAALLRAKDSKARDLIRAAIQRNSRDIKTRQVSGCGNKPL